MVKSYATADEADRGIDAQIRDFYQKQYPALAQAQDQNLKAAIAETKRIYHLNFFPEMKVSWQAYPENIGHKEFPGCFRCHDGKHVSAGGKLINRDCGACHEFLERGTGGALVRMAATPAFAHPWKLAGKHAELLCGACHTGGPAKPATCRGCHGIAESGSPMAGMQCKECHLKEQQVKPLATCTTCHGALAGLHQKVPHKAAGCVACHAPHQWKVEGRDRCLTCHGDRAQHNPGAACSECHEYRPTTAAVKPGAPPAKGGPLPITFRADPNSPGPVTFEHAKHLAKGAKCADCHPTLFKMQKGADKLSMDSMGEGKLCGACHNGTKAFGVMDGDRCATCHKGS
jgi:c(7)-type cytochrome triheme protein